MNGITQKQLDELREETGSEYELMLINLAAAEEWLRIKARVRELEETLGKVVKGSFYGASTGYSHVDPSLIYEARKVLSAPQPKEVA